MTKNDLSAASLCGTRQGDWLTLLGSLTSGWCSYKRQCIDECFL